MAFQYGNERGRMILNPFDPSYLFVDKSSFNHPILPILARLIYPTVFAIQVNVMYQTSLKQFLQLFDGSLMKAMRTPNINERVHSVLSTLNYEVWVYALRGLYEQHQFLFTLLMAIKIDLHSGHITHAEFMKLIKGAASIPSSSLPSCT